MNEQLAEAIFVSGAPIAMVENPVWKKFFKSMRPAFTPPSRKHVSSTLLDKKYEEVKKSLEENLKNAINMHLQCDGWSNIRNEAIINFVITTPEPVFVKFLDTKDNRHTAEYLCGEILNVLKKHGAEKFLCLIGDNAPNIQKAFSLVVQQFPHLIALGCLAHSLHLLCGDILKTESVKKFMANITDIAKKIKGVQILNAMFNELCCERKCDTSLKLPGATRWGSSLTCLQSFKKLKIPLQQLAVKEEAQGVLPDNMKRMILDDDIFWIKIGKFIDLLNPIVKWITILQTNKCIIHSVTTAVREIKNSLNVFLPESPVVKKEEEMITVAFEKRKGSMLQPIHYAAAILDPNNQGFHLEQCEQIDGLQFIHEMASDLNLQVMPELLHYRNKQDIWSKSFLWSCAPTTEPITWWKGFCSTTILSTVAVRILSAPVTSAETERSFSKFSFIHNKRRNKLKTDRAGKLTYIAFNWQLSQESIFHKSHSQTQLSMNAETDFHMDTDDYQDDHRESDSSCYTYTDDSDSE